MKEDFFSEKTIERKEIFNGHVIKVAVDQVELADGTKAERELVFHNGGVGILAITKDEQMVLVRQFRKPLERTILEIPAGKIELDEKDPLQTAIRELAEETGFGCQTMDKLLDFSLSPGFANEIMYLYEAKGLYPLAKKVAQDYDERIEVVLVSLAEAKRLIATQEIYDSKTIIAVQMWELATLRNQ